MERMQRIRIGAPIVALALAAGALATRGIGEEKLLLLILIGILLAYTICLSFDIEERPEALRETIVPLSLSTVCYLFASATLAESVLELIDRWGGCSGFAMMYFLRLVILPCSGLGLIAAVIPARAGIWSGAVLLTFHILVVLLIAVPMFVFM